MSLSRFSLLLALIVSVPFFSPEAVASDETFGPEFRGGGHEEKMPTPGEDWVSAAVIYSGTGSLKSLMPSAKAHSVAGQTIYRGKVTRAQLAKIAQQKDVLAVQESGPRTPPGPVDPDVDGIDRRKVSDSVFMKALREAPSFSQAEKLKPADESHTKSWWGKDTIGVPEAWAQGYDGSGVKIAIIDTGVDFANPDLMGTEARVDNPASPHHGWPLCYDGHSLEKYFLNGETEDTWIVDVSATPMVTAGTTTSTADFTVLVDGFQQLRTFTFWSESVSGVYRFGIHPDLSLRDVLGGDTPAVLVVDHPDTAARGNGYNTVYVDLDGDFDFTDEKPCFRGDEISYRDVLDSNSGFPGADGFPDVSGGMVYFIANGERPFPAADWLYGAQVPANGSIVAFMLNDIDTSGGNHGTTCASAAVARGLINGDPPPVKPPFTGPGNGMVQGPAPGARIISVGNYYRGGIESDFHLFCAYGYDGVPNTGDEANIVSMSFGNGSTDNDSWDYSSRFIAGLNRRVATETVWVNSSGNGAPGYATLTSPGPEGTVAVGASTAYGTCNYFDSTILNPDQILSGDVSSFSGSGTDAAGNQGLTVVATGAWGSGNLPLNEARDGWKAWGQWGGTSRACPEAAGILALIYQAYRNTHSVWPTSKVAKEILMNSAVDLGYEIQRQGAGRVHAGRAVALAASTGGIGASPPLWEAGHYRGNRYSAYNKSLMAGESDSQTVMVTNHNNARIPLTVKDTCLEAFGQVDLTFNTLAVPQEEQLFRKPDYLQLFQGPGLDQIPPETVLVSFEMIVPFEVFDTSYIPGPPAGVFPPNENAYRLIVYDWTDVDQDGLLWDDSLGIVPGLVETGEIDEAEYMRFNYGYVVGTSLKSWVSDPLAKMHDGIFVGVRHRTSPPEGASTQLKVRAVFYRETDCPWVSVDQSMLDIDAGATVPLSIQARPPADFPPGFYSAKVHLVPPSGPDTIIPVSVNVPADFATGKLVIAATETSYGPFQNHALLGDFSWGGQRESGDGRLFFFDVDNPAAGDYLLAKTSWQDDLPTDIDTQVFGPTPDPFTDPGSSLYHADFGPNTLSSVGGITSPGWTYRWFETGSGGQADFSLSPIADGLHALFAHNRVFSGKKFSVPFSIEAGLFQVSPTPLQVTTGDSEVDFAVTLTSQLAIDNVQFSAYGPSEELKWYENHPIEQDHFWWINFTITNSVYVEVELTGTAEDLDMDVYMDGANGGTLNNSFSGVEFIGGSYLDGSHERFILRHPRDGFYLFQAYGTRVASITDTFSLTAKVIPNQAVSVTPGKTLKLSEGIPQQVNVSTTLPSTGDYNILLSMGPPEGPDSVSLLVPISYFTPGDVNDDGVFNVTDWMGVSKYWKSGAGVPSPIDSNSSGTFDAHDLLYMIENWRE